MSYEPLHHKYRPQTFADLVGQEAITQTLINAIRTQRIAPAYLFTGPRGTGKTSSARILAKSLNCLKQDKPTESPCGRCEVCTTVALGNALDVIEIDAASNTGVDNIREIIEKAQFAPVQCRYKVYAIDECHMLSVAAFNALLKTLEEPPKHVVFVLATTDPQRVLPTIISRCQRFDFRRIPLEAMVQHLQKIAANETIDITTDALTLVAQVAQGGLRDAESLLDQLSLLPEQVTVEAVWDLVGAVPERDLLALARAIASDNSEAVFDHCRRLMDRGREPLVVLQNLAGFYRDLLVARTAPKRNDLVAMTPPTWKELCEFARELDSSRILQGQQHLKNSEVQIKNTTQPRLWLEVTLLGLLPSANPSSTVSQPPISNSPAVSRQEPQTPREPSAPNSSHFSSPNQAPAVERGSPAATSRQNGTQSPPPQPSQHESQPPTTVRASPTSNSVQPVASEVPPANSTDSEEPVDAIASPHNIEQLWQKVLNALQPYATQALLRQHGHLLSIEGSVAQVGFSSGPLLKFAQEKLPNIEAAFQAVYKSKVKVILQTKAKKPSKTADASEPTPQAAITPPVTDSVSTPNANSVQPALAVSKVEPFSSGGRNGASIAKQGQETEPYSSQGREEETSGVLKQENFRIYREHGNDIFTDASASVLPTESLTTFSVKDTEWDVEVIEKSLVNLKQFFEGEIVELGDDFSQRESLGTGLLTSDDETEDVTKPLAVELEDYQREKLEPFSSQLLELDNEIEDIELLEIEPEEDQQELGGIESQDSDQWQASKLAALKNAEIQKRLEALGYDEDDEDIPF